MIRFSAFLVAAAVGLLIAGVVTSKLLLVYLAIGASGVALLALGIGVAVNWRELTGKPTTAAAEASAQGPAAPSQVPAAPAPAAAATSAAQPQASVPATFVSAAAGSAAPGTDTSGSGWPATVPAASASPGGPSRAGYLPTEPPLEAQLFGTQPAVTQSAGAQYPRRCSVGESSTTELPSSNCESELELPFPVVT